MVFVLTGGSMRCVNIASHTTHTVDRGSKPLHRPFQNKNNYFLHSKSRKVILILTFADIAFKFTYNVLTTNVNNTK